MQSLSLLIDSFSEIIELGCHAGVLFIDLVLTCIELRFCLGWFLNINPYFEPLLSLWAFTHPFMWLGRNNYPRIFGLDMTPIINYRLLGIIRKYLEAAAVWQKTHRSIVEETEIYDPFNKDTKWNYYETPLMEIINSNKSSENLLEISSIGGGMNVESWHLYDPGSINILNHIDSFQNEKIVTYSITNIWDIINNIFEMIQ